MKRLFMTLFAFLALMVTKASALPITVDMAPATTDITTVFTAIVTVGVLMFGFRKIRGMLKA